MPTLSNIKIDFHRNGVSGNPFYVATFTAKYDDNLLGNMFAVVFPEESSVAVFDLDKLAAGDIKFGSNSWRGDYYEAPLRQAIADWRKVEFGEDK